MKNNEKLCLLCQRAKFHARKHGKDDTHVLCIVHRAMAWLSSNAYHDGNVEWRNPMSADKYVSYETEIESLIPDNPCFIAKGFVYLVNREDRQDVLLQPVVVADLVDQQYINRRFAVYAYIPSTEKKGVEEGLIFENIEYFFYYAGYSSIRAITNTCTYGDAGIDGNFYAEDYRLSKKTQRLSCEECNKKKLLYKSITLNNN